jgi:hypothetical protein
MVEAKTHCWRQTRQQKLGRNRGIPKTQRVLTSTNKLKNLNLTKIEIQTKTFFATIFNPNRPNPLLQ